MKKSLFPLVALLLSLASCSSNAGDKKHPIDDSKNSQYLFVLTAESGAIDGSTLMLNGVKNVIYFSDRPHRIAGQMKLDKFDEMWSKGKNGFQRVPPNAILEIIESGNSLSFSIELASPVTKGDQIIFKIHGADEPEFGDFGPASLFIDGFDTVNPQIVD